MARDDSYVFVNGRFVSAARATVSVYDRGLLYGDGLFETLRAYQGVVFALEEHIDRLGLSAQVLGLPIPDLDWRAIMSELLRRNQLQRRDAWVRLTVTRGPSEPDPLPPRDPRPTTIIMVRPVDARIAEMQRRGVAVTLLPFSRHGFIPEHKSLNYLPAVIGKVLAARQGAYEGLFVRSDHFLTEGTTSSLFVVHNQELWTVPVGGILPGVTRGLVAQIAANAGMAVVERDITSADLRLSDEAFLTSAVAEIVPIVRVDGTRLGGARRGPVTRKVQRLYHAAVKAYAGRRSTGA